MKKEILIILILLAIIVSAVLFRKPIKKSMTRGYRNNNPGNIRLTSTMWQGEIKGDDKAFKKFRSMDYGYRAIFVLLNTYYKNGFNTIRKIITRYAPSNENKTDAYISTVSRRSGIDPDKQLSLADKDSYIKIVEAISYVENGIVPDMKEIYSGYSLI